MLESDILNAHPRVFEARDSIKRILDVAGIDHAIFTGVFDYRYRDPS